MPYVLTFNAGSSSLKAAAYTADKMTPVLSAAIENIGQTQPVFHARAAVGAQAQPASVQATDHQTAAGALCTWLERHLSKESVVSAVGHRIVHGGTLYHKPTIVSARLIKDLESLRELDPDHMPAALATLSTLQERFPHAAHVACFDTAFFRDLPAVAQRLPLPRRFYDKGLRRYGFHGLSYAYLLESFAAHEGKAAARGRIIIAHLGSGASLCALKDGKPVDTTMGFTPAGGIPMSTRSGDLDPGVVWFLHRQAGQSPGQFHQMVNAESGLLGVSGKTAEMHSLLERQHTDPHAAEAVELFCYQVTKAIGSLSAILGGVDSLIFSGGIGERSAEIRERVCANLAYLGIELDARRNHKAARLISRESAGAGVHVIPTDESLMLALQTTQVIKGGR